MNFTPTPEELSEKVPYFEDARADFAPYYSTKKAMKQAMAEVSDELGKLGAAVLGFTPGFYGTSPKRHGYQINFAYRGGPGRIDVAGLPMRRESPAKINQVRVQALLNVRDWLKASVTQRVFAPGNEPLLQFMLVDGRRTLLEAVQESGRLALPEVIDGEFEEA